MDMSLTIPRAASTELHSEARRPRIRLSRPPLWGCPIVGPADVKRRRRADDHRRVAASKCERRSAVAACCRLVAARAIEGIEA
jgi:hypothetical protein